MTGYCHKKVAVTSATLAILWVLRGLPKAIVISAS